MIDKERVYNTLKRKLISSQPLLNMLNVKKTDTILNIGCGYNPQAVLFAEKVREIYSIDSDENNVKIASLVVKKYNLKNIYTKEGDITKLDYFDNFFDIVLAIDVLEHVKDIDMGLKEIYRVVKRNGTAIVTAPLLEEKYTQIFNFFYKMKHKKMLKKRWTEENYRRSIPYYIKIIKKAGFKIEKTMASTLFPPLHWIGIPMFWYTNKYIHYLDQILCSFPIIKNFGQSLFFIIKKQK